MWVFEQQRYPEGHPKGGQFMPKDADDEGDRIARAEDGGDADVVEGESEAAAKLLDAVKTQSDARQAREDARADRQHTPEARPGLFHSANRHMTDGDATGPLSEDSPWTEERRAMHAEILEKATAGVPASDDPTVWFMGGGPASGKSTLLKSGQLTHPAIHVALDPDAFKEDTPDYRDNKAMVGGCGGTRTEVNKTAAAYDAQEESSYLTKHAAKIAQANKQDVVWDGTGDGRLSSMVSKIQAFRDAGYKVKADYATLDTELAVQLAKKRAERTGRRVPPEITRRTHAAVSSIWPNLARQGMFDESTVYDTNEQGVARPIARADRSGRIDVLDPERYAKFLNKANQ